MMGVEEFLSLSSQEVAYLVRQAGPQVCVFPINGTRRWFTLEHPDADPKEYILIAALEYIRLFKMLFEHGIDTILSPLFGSELLIRGEKYITEALGGAVILESPEFLSFYDELQVRVGFYGEYTRTLSGTSHAGLLELFDRLVGRTDRTARRRLFFGLFGNDATVAVGRLAIDIHRETGKVPDRRALVVAYYGDYIDPVTLFFGFEKPSIFDYPLLNLGEEDLYFTVAPSPYLTERVLRAILYDHLYTRQFPEPNWFDMTEEKRTLMREYYTDCRERVIGVGEIHEGFWRPSS